uniref:Cytidine deaminase n=1 Tax=Syphacia muris TaxID=451379 RepID=A0A0N5AWJ4_9BILA
MDDKALVAKAIKAMERAYVPYSKFPVGAALLCKDGTVITGANIENSSYGATICAERSAVVRACAEGHRDFVALAVSTELEEPASPCGICRQVLIEFGDFKVIMASSNSDKTIVTSTYGLLPYAFTPKSLEDHAKQAKK